MRTFAVCRARVVLVAGRALPGRAATAAVALIASLVPAYRAAQLDPLKVLRAD